MSEKPAINEKYIGYKTWAILDRLAKVHTASDFGRVNQALLSIAFQYAGFKVSHFQGTGRPDFIADRINEGYAIEVKAPLSQVVSFTKDDIDGIVNLGHEPILAILTYPSVDVKWSLIPTHKLSPKSHKKSDIERFSLGQLDREISLSFLKALEEHKEKALLGAYTLQSLVESK